MPQFEDTDLILNFHDAVIYGSDLALVSSPTEWLNDACIHFFFEWLTEQQQPSNNTFMDPSVVSFFVHQCTDDDEIQEFVASFPRQGKILIPVNDSMTNRAGPWRGGSHWSLLVVIVLANDPSCSSNDKKSHHFWHFDSVRNSGNAKAVQTIAQKLGKHAFGLSEVVVVEAATPQQSNGYDCGVHMLAAAQLFSGMGVMDDLKAHETKLDQHTREHPNFCHELRQFIANEILRQSSKS